MFAIDCFAHICTGHCFVLTGRRRICALLSTSLNARWQRCHEQVMPVQARLALVLLLLYLSQSRMYGTVTAYLRLLILCK